MAKEYNPSVEPVSFVYLKEHLHSLIKYALIVFVV